MPTMPTSQRHGLFFLSKKNKKSLKHFLIRGGKHCFRKVSSHNAVLTREVRMAVRDPGFSCVSGRDGSSLNTGKGRLRTAHGPFPQQKTLSVGVTNIVTVQILCQIQLFVCQRLAIKIQHFLKICIHAYEVIIFSINSVHHDKVVSKPSLKTWLFLKHEGWSLSPMCATQNTKPIPDLPPSSAGPFSAVHTA